MQLDLQRYSLEKQLSAQRELLERQQNQSREEVRIAKPYSLTEEFAVNVAAILHSMLRAMWPATQNGTIDKKRIESYNKEAYTLLPKITGLQATIAALDMARLDSLRPLVNQIYELDADIGRDGALLKGPPSDQSELSELHARVLRYHARAYDLEKNLPSAIRGIVEPPSEKLCTNGRLRT
jgi:hypothetical protein